MSREKLSVAATSSNDTVSEYSTSSSDVLDDAFADSGVGVCADVRITKKRHIATHRPMRRRVILFFMCRSIWNVGLVMLA